MRFFPNRRRNSSPSSRPPPSPSPSLASSAPSSCAPTRNVNHDSNATASASGSGPALTRSASAQPYHTSSTSASASAPHHKQYTKSSPRLSSSEFNDARQRWSQLARDRRSGLSLASEELENATASIDSINFLDNGVRHLCTPLNFDYNSSSFLNPHPHAHRLSTTASASTSETVSASSSVASAGAPTTAAAMASNAAVTNNNPSPNSFPLPPVNSNPAPSSSTFRPPHPSSSHYPLSTHTPNSSPVIAPRQTTFQNIDDPNNVNVVGATAAQSNNPGSSVARSANININYNNAAISSTPNTAGAMSTSGGSTSSTGAVVGSPGPHLNFKVDYAELTALKQKFNQLDAEGKGFLSRSQFYELFSSFMDSSAHDPHHTPMFNFAYSLFQSAGDRLNLREFVTGMSVLSKGSEEERLRYLFMMYDKDNSGNLNTVELKQVFRVMGSYAASHDFRASDSLDSQSLSSLRKINPAVLDALVEKTVREYDLDGDGEIGLDDFIKWCGRDPVVKTWMDMLCYDTARGVARLRGESEKELIARELEGLGIVENEFWRDSFNLQNQPSSTSTSATSNTSILPPTMNMNVNNDQSDSSDEMNLGMHHRRRRRSTVGGSQSPSASGMFTPGTSNTDLERRSSHNNMTKTAIGSFEIDFRTLIFEKQIGSGSFATVYKCKWLDSPVAVKVFKSGPRLVINPDGTPSTIPTSSTVTSDQSAGGRRESHGGGRSGGAFLENGESFEAEFDSRRGAAMPSAVGAGGGLGAGGGGMQQSLFGDDIMETEMNTNRVRFLQEISLLKSIRHPNLLLYMGACVDPNYPLCIVSELMDGGSLFELLHGRDKVQLTIRQKLLLTQDIARGMLYLHGRDPIVLHRDLKSANILVELQNDDSFKGTIIDFGLSKLSSTQASIVPGRGRGLTGSLVTMAPEVMNEQEYEPRSDVYSFAIIAWEIWCGRIPFGKLSGPTQLLMKVAVQGERPEFLHSDNVPSAIQKLIRACWDQDVRKRPDFLMVVRTLNEIRHDLKVDVDDD